MNKIITISREYGAGGHSIGREVADQLGIKLYDYDIVKKTMEESGFDKNVIEREEEELTKSEDIWKKISAFSSAYFNDTKDAIHEVQKAIILSLAKQGPCVIVGRCADVFLKEAGYETFNVFLHASEIHRAVSVSELIGSKDANVIAKAMKQKDTARENYYKHYSGKRWGDCRNYDLTLDSGKLGYDYCARMIVEAVKSLEQ